ncbi:hypothetical protein [Bacillus wiedmannii]|uniref:hypothetical protein n=1 Tax=Bacillus wiedmannii TaxID=1890302 RepID=UPI000BF0B904|nr:hypothetical protein [Bacillus wiedmannii]MCU5516613.1 hypothetical protein [Bacillus wiedmannii]MCU5706543.1 hypothetical protein [Bacillus wiedmannii]PEI72626.1 hypothetical protein CN646_08390 [Bacillus wiedmannii]PEK62080.1 hypothetical protein CN595_10345 [Bacillus wiedmannii]PEL65742.1 hypothetical protein CN622_04855 [Bacillus wiedmannii]
MHKPFLIAYSPYNHHIYTKIMIAPMYMQVSPSVVPLQMQYPHPPIAHAQQYVYETAFYKHPYFKQFHNNVKAQVWEG